MKKTFSLLSIVFLLAVLFTSCKEEMKNEPFENGIATIIGTALVNLDITNDTIGIIYEHAPEGTQIYATINSIDLVETPSLSTHYGDITTVAQVNAAGEFTFEVSANTKIVTVDFSADDFRANQRQADSTMVSKVFYLPTGFSGYSENVSEGVTRITEITFEKK